MKRREFAGISTIQNLLFLLHSKPSLRQSHKIYNKALKLYGPLPNITWAYMFGLFHLDENFSAPTSPILSLHSKIAYKTAWA